jgi:hypothetical protein
MGRYDVLMDAGLPGLVMGITKGFFHIDGMLALATERLKRAVKKVISV